MRGRTFSLRIYVKYLLYLVGYCWRLLYWRQDITRQRKGGIFVEELIGWIIGIVLLIWLVGTFWEFFLATAVIVGIIYLIYKVSKAEAERQQQEALKRAEEIRHITQNMNDKVKRIAAGIRHPVWDSPQAGEAMSAVFSVNADNAILLGELLAEAVEAGKNS